MAERGYGFLGWNTRFRGAEDQFILEHALVDIAVGMRWLKEVAGVETTPCCSAFRRRLADGRVSEKAEGAQHLTLTGKRRDCSLRCQGRIDERQTFTSP